MSRTTCLRVGAVALALPIAAVSGLSARARSADYRFELAGAPRLSGATDIVGVRLIHVPDGKPVDGAVIFESTADMGPAGMPTMPAPVTPMPATDGVYVFAIEPGMTGKWAIHLAAKVQGEPETVRGTVVADLVK